MRKLKRVIVAVVIIVITTTLSGSGQGLVQETTEVFKLVAPPPQEPEYLFIENDDGKIVKSDITVADGAAAIYRYFKEDGINAPLYNYGKIFAIVSRELRLDWRLLPAIAMQESTGGKFLFRPYNAFGFGRYIFTSHKEAIRTVGEALAGTSSPSYKRWYGGKNIRAKLRIYNSERPTYVEEVKQKMRSISYALIRNQREGQ